MVPSIAEKLVPLKDKIYRDANGNSLVKAGNFTEN
jgi:hypothetical protein